MLANHLKDLKRRDTELTEMFDQIQFIDGKKLKEKELRASSFPVCPLLFLESYLFPIASYQNTYHSSYHTEIGNFIHAYLQDNIAKTGDGKIFGSYKCDDCGHTTEKVFHAQCEKCDSKNVHYHELDVNYLNTLTGHIDGVVITFTRDNKGVVTRINIKPLDYKTCSLADAKYLPTPKHLLQLSIYAVLLERDLIVYFKDEYPDAVVEVTDLSILYVPKDKPSKRMEYNIVFNSALRAEARYMVEYAVYGYEIYLDLREVLELPPEQRKTADVQAEVQGLLKELYEARTCNACQQLAPGLQPIKFYEQRVKPFFFEKVDLGGKTSFEKRCLLDSRCMDYKAWLNSVYSDAIFGDRQERTVRKKKGSPFA